MKYRLICSDLDDTLIDKDTKVGKGLKAAIEKYVKIGGKFCIVTGRMTSGAIPVCKELGLHGEVITYQGSMVSDIDTGDVLYSKTIPRDEAVEIGRFIEESGYYYQTYVGSRFYAEKPNSFTSVYSTLSHAEFVQTEGKLSDFILQNNVNPPKLLSMAAPKDIPAMLQKLRGKFGDRYLINTSKPFIIEIIPSGVSKGLAVKKLAEKYGIKREEIICVGDSENDLTMIEYAGLGVVVASGSEIAKEKADVIAPGMNDDPITWVIEKYGFLL